MEGREQVLRFNRDKKQVWENALERLRSPAKKRLWVKTFSNKPFGVKAGLSALAHYSNLAEPPVFLPWTRLVWISGSQKTLISLIDIDGIQTVILEFRLICVGYPFCCSSL